MVDAAGPALIPRTEMNEYEIAAIEWLVQRERGFGSASYRYSIWATFHAVEQGAMRRLRVVFSEGALLPVTTHETTISYEGGRLMSLVRLKHGRESLVIGYTPETRLYHYDDAVAARHETMTPQDLSIALGFGIVHPWSKASALPEYPITDKPVWLDDGIARVVDDLRHTLAHHCWPGEGKVGAWWCVHEYDDVATLDRRFDGKAAMVRLMRGEVGRRAILVSVMLGDSVVNLAVSETIAYMAAHPTGAPHFVIRIGGPDGEHLVLSKYPPFPDPYTGQHGGGSRRVDPGDGGHSAAET